MSILQSRNIIFPAVLASSIVFSALTLPLVLFEPKLSNPGSNVASTEPPSLLSQGFQPILDIFGSGNKGLAIRYIGLSIVASVGTGIATAELMRKASRRLEFLVDHGASFSFEEKASQSPSDLPPAYAVADWPDAWVADHTLVSGSDRPVTLEAPTPAPIEAIPSWVDLDDAEYAEYADSSISLEERIRAEDVITNTFTPDYDRVPLEEDRSIAPESNLVAIITDPTSYTTCRISIPHVAKRLFAVLYHGEYYRLVRTRKSRDKALALAMRLQQVGGEVLITQNDTNYTVWILEAQAFPCSAYPN